MCRRGCASSWLEGARPRARDHRRLLARALLFADAARSCGPRPARPFGGSRCQPPAMAATIALRSRRAYTRPTARGACAASRSGANWESHAAAAGARAPGRERTAPASGRAARRRAAMPEAVDDTALLRPANTMRQVQRRTGGTATGATERRTSRANAFASSNLTSSPVTAEPAAMASAEPNPVDEQHAIGVAARGTAHLSGAHGRLAGRDEAERAVWAHDPQGRCDPAGRDRTVDSSAETEGPSLPLEAARRGPPLAGSCAPLRELPAGRRAVLGGLGAPP
jgi:hypothetical protein